MGPWSLVGRVDELNRLTAAVTGDGGGLIFSGTAGIGKSRLLREATTALSADRYAVHAAAANIASSGLPFGGLAQVLPPDPPGGLSPAGLLRWAADDLQRAATGRRIVLAVDDVHLIDPPSAALVHLLVREGARLLGTLRSGEPVPRPISTLWTEGLIEHAELLPLDEQESAELLTRMLGGPVEAVTARRLVRLAVGNALLLRELVIAATGGGEMTRPYGLWRWTGRLSLAPALADLIDMRIGRLDPGTRDVLELVALGEPIGLQLLQAAAGAGNVEAAEERGLIRVVTDGRRRDVRLAHPLYGEVVRRQCPVTRAHRLLGTLAGLVQHAGARRRDDLLRVALWRLDSGTAQNSSMLLAAAKQAANRFDIELAMRLAAAARDTGAGYPAAELLSTVLVFADQPERALQVLIEDEALADTPHLRGRWLTLRASVAFWGLGRAEAVAELSAAAAAVDEPAAVIRVRAVEALMRLYLKETARATTLAEAVLAEPAAGATARAMSWCVLALVRSMRGEPHRSAELLAEVDAHTAEWRRDSPSLQYVRQVAVGTQLTVSLDLPGIEAIVATEFADLAEAGGFGFGSGWAASLRTRAALLRGRTEEALRASEQACVALSANRMQDGNANALRAAVAAMRGDTVLAAASMAAADQAAERCVEFFYMWREQARAWTAAASGDVAAAVSLIQDLVARLRADGFVANELLALYDLVRWGHAGQAVERTAALVAGGVGGDTAPLLLRHARAGADRDGDGLVAVGRAFSERGFMLFAAEAAAGAVALFRSTRDPRLHDASTLLADVLARCDTVRTPALVAVQPSLTVRERQVAELAADGVRSRDIADRLFLSPRTVENHLQRVYQKLGVTGRMELGLALRSLPEWGVS